MEAKTRRDSIPFDQRVTYSHDIALIAQKKIDVSQGNIVAGFWPLNSEIDIRPTLLVLHEKGARLCLPVRLKHTHIIFREFIADSALFDTGWGTRGPGEDAQVLEPDIIFMPLLGFDRYGNRLGYGAGCYDRALAPLQKKRKNLQLIGVAFDCQEYESLPFEEHDILITHILTPSGLRKSSSDSIS